MSTSDSVTPGLYSEALVRQTPWLRGERTYGLRLALVACEWIADFASAAAGMAAALLFSGAKNHSLAEVATISATCGLLAVLDLRANRAYEGGGSLLQLRETERILRAAVHSSLLLAPVLLVFTVGISKTAITMAPIGIAVSLMMQKRCFFLVLRKVDRVQDARERVVIYGAGAAARRVVSALTCSVRLGLHPVAIIDDSPDAMDRTVLELGYRERGSVAVHAASMTQEFLHRCGCTTLVIATDGLAKAQIEAAAECARLSSAKVALMSEPSLYEGSGGTHRMVDGWMLSMDASETRAGLYDTSKRVIDVVLASVALFAFSPILFMIAAAIKLDSAGPVLFIQKRVGLNGRVFRIFKFRSMYAGSARYEPSPTSSADPRLTRVGRVLRRLSLDELPQLVNVVRGEMSLVGPRPEMPFVVQGYEPHQRKRLTVMPGITGLWQLSADRAFPIHENLEYDLYYVQNRSLFMDLAVLIHTVLFAMRGGI